LNTVEKFVDGALSSKTGGVAEPPVAGMTVTEPLTPEMLPSTRNCWLQRSS
jgi:hypothetical protein